MKLNASLLFIAFLLTTGCTALFTEQKYVLIDEEVKETFLPSGMLFSISEKRDIRKFVILGEGTIRNIDIYARDAKDNWKLIKKMKKPVTFPFDGSDIIRHVVDIAKRFQHDLSAVHATFPNVIGLLRLPPCAISGFPKSSAHTIAFACCAATDERRLKPT